LAVNNLRRVINLTKDLDANGDIQDSSLADGIFTLPTPKITSVHPTANLSQGDLVFVVGSGFDQGANVLLISNTGVETVGGNVAFNSTSNVTFTWPLEAGSGDLNPYDIILEISNGTANTSHNSANGRILEVSEFQGTVSGYSSGGLTPYFNTIDKFSFSSDGNATDVGDLPTGVFGAAGSSSTTHGYSSGGASFPGPGTNRIDKFPFASDTNATNVGTQTALRYSAAGVTSTTHGYAAGGRTPTALNVIDKFPFASDGASSDVGDILSAKYELAGITSETHGYVSGGGFPLSNVIEKFPVSSDTNSTDVGDLTVARYGPSGQFSESHGYTSGGSGSNVIDKFPFASDTNATDVGDLLTNKFNSAGHSSTTSGYASGGNPNSNVIEKFPFFSDSNSTDVGDLTVARYLASSQQV